MSTALPIASIMSTTTPFDTREEFLASREPKLRTLPIASIRRDGGAQIRAELSQETMESYAEKYLAGVAMPPVNVMDDGADLWLWEGFHRVAGREMAGFLDIEAEIKRGTRRDAVLLACGANDEHGLPRSNADKRRAVQTMLADEECAGWSDYKIAEWCKVSHQLVRSLRPSLPTDASETRTYKTKHGTVATMNVAKIGVREKQTSNPTLQVEVLLLSVRSVMAVLPSPAAVAAMLQRFDPDEADRYAIWWGDLAIELRDRLERAS